MKANPGGQIDPDSAIGRSELITEIWQTVENQSVVMTAERRIGKTTVMRIMKASPPEGWVAVFRDLEKYHTAAEFAMGVYRDVHQFLSKTKKATRRTSELLKALGGLEIDGLFRLPDAKASVWKDILTRAIEDLCIESQDKGEHLLFLWDEMPFMLENIRNREGEATAMEVLDVLRSLRMTHSSLRMIFTGSIGLHHVIQSLKDKNYGNSPVNDMFAIEVQPLSKDDSTAHSMRLHEGEKLEVPDLIQTARTIASEADYFPYYIHHVVKALKIKRQAVDIDSVLETVSAQLVEATDPWELRHYRDRIKRYYGAENENTVVALLDHIATSPTPQSVGNLLDYLKNVSKFDDREQLISLLNLMQQDHYLHRDIDGGYTIQFSLIRRWWQLIRGL